MFSLRVIIPFYYVIEYAYSVLAQLTKVRMERPGKGFNPATVVQERTFVYNSEQRLQWVTHPESGMTSYSYNFDGTMKGTTDALGQKTQWTYDAMGRPTLAQKFRAGGTEELCGKVQYFYDSQNLDSSFAGSNLSARLAAVETGCAAQGGVLQELYSYNVAGAALTKRVRITRGSSTVTKDIGYSFDAEGKLATVQYPDVARPFTYFYDSMGRPNRMTGVGWDDSSSTVNTVDHVNGVSYGTGGELLGMTYLQSDPVAQETNRYFVESRSYNSRLQLTRQTTVLNAGATVTDIKYNFSATANDGRIESRENVVSGEAVSYQYDSLNRLVRAEQTAGPAVPGTGLMWGLTFNYDGFGNRWDQTIISGKAGIPSTIQFNQSLNRILGSSYDANGNMTGGLTYDVDNRLLTASNEQYGYLADNKRFWKGLWDEAEGKYTGETYYLYGVEGQRIMSYPVTVVSGVLTFQVPKLDVAFGGRVIRLNGVGVVQDRLGSVVTRANGTAVPEQNRYYPYGEEVGTATTGDRNKFGTYHRDQTGLDYADQRFHASTWGRFLTPDPYPPADGMTDPGQWNRYSYSAGDPINSLDPEGLLVIKINGAFNGDPDWIKADSEFSAAVAATFPGQTIVSWSWPGWGVTQLLAYSGIYAAGDALAAFINSYQYAPGEALNIVAFSDGGNVAKVASWKISRPIDNLVTLGTPQNWDLPDIYRPRVKNYCNVSSLADPVQFAGSSLNQIYNTIVDAYDAGLAQFYGWQAFFAGNYSAFGYYQRVSALLAARSTAWMMTTRIDPYANHNVLRTTDSHFGLHTRQVWNEIKRPCGL